MSDRRPIAVFDSGIGGLTVARALRDTLPNEDIVYFGDTARVPYGTKTRETVLRFSQENCAFLLRTEPKCIVAACNTVSATCLPVLRDDLPVPVFGVVEPGSSAAVEASGRQGLIAVLATEATVASNAYKNAIIAADSRRAVVQLACPLFVPIIEEGLDEANTIVAPVLRRYLSPLKRLKPAVVVLGCTHYPILAPALAAYFGKSAQLVDSGTSTARVVEQSLRSTGALSQSRREGRLHCYVSDNPRRFQTVGSRFLGEPIHDVVRVCPEELADAGWLLRKSPPRATA